jgi:hypothetical protein
MLFDILQTITDFVVLLTRLTAEDLADEQRVALIDQFIHIQRLGAAFESDLHNLLMILITMLIIIFWRTWRGIGRTVGRIADSNCAQAFERHWYLRAVLFASHRVWLRVTKRALPGKASARSIFKLESQGEIKHVF